jgi:hypothetical protein
MICNSCGKDKATSQFNLDGPSPDICFKCRLSSVSIGFGGHREFFHNDTVKAFQERQVAEGRANGLDPIPAWHNTNTGTTAGGMERLKKHHKNLAESKGTKNAI